MKRLLCFSLFMIIVIALLSLLASEKETYLIHLKTSLKKDDAQI